MWTEGFNFKYTAPAFAVVRCSCSALAICCALNPEPYKVCLKFSREQAFLLDRSPLPSRMAAVEGGFVDACMIMSEGVVLDTITAWIGLAFMAIETFY